MGLLDFENPNTAGMMKLGLGLLSAGGPSRMPVSVGQGIGMAGSAAMDEMQQVRQQQVQNQLRNAQMEELKQKQLKDLELQKILDAFSSQLPPDQQAEFRVDPKGFMEAKRNEAEMKAFLASQVPQPSSNLTGFEPLPSTQQGAPFAGMQGMVGNVAQMSQDVATRQDLSPEDRGGILNQIRLQQQSGATTPQMPLGLFSPNKMIQAATKFQLGQQEKKDARAENRDFISNVVEAGKDRRFSEGEAGKDRRVLKATSFGDVSLAGQAYFDSMPPDKQALVKGMLDYSIDPKSFSQRGQNREQAIAAAKQVDPNFNTMKYGIRYEVIKDFTKGKTADNIVAIDQAINHIGTLGQLAEALNSGNVQSANYIANAISKQFGDPRITNAELAAQAVGEELMRVFRQVGASEREAAAWEEKFKASKSPEQMIGAIQTGTKLLSGRINAVNNRWNNGMDVKTGYPNILSDEAKQTLEKYGVSMGAAGGGVPSKGDGWAIVR